MYSYVVRGSEKMWNEHLLKPKANSGFGQASAKDWLDNMETRGY
jgi:hypothetical protein